MDSRSHFRKVRVFYGDCEDVVERLATIRAFERSRGKLDVMSTVQIKG
jgi:hypothetical protein